MDAATAQARLKRMVAWESEPALDQTDIDALVDLAKRADADGRAPSDADWAGAYDLNAAACEGWRWKMGQAASRVTISTDGQTISRSDYLTHCREMIREYQKRMVVGVSATRYDDDGLEVR